MLKQHLPMVQRQVRQYQQLSALWQSQGYGCPERALPARDTLLRFSTDSGWDGIIDVTTWFGTVAPGLAAQASHAWTLPQLATLFMNSEQPLDHADLPELLHYQRIDVKGFITSHNQASALCHHVFHGKRGDIWFCDMSSLPEMVNQGEHIHRAGIPLTLNFCIGLSTLSTMWLKKIQPGDALFIQHQVSDLMVDNNKIGRFIRLEEGYMFEAAEQVIAPQSGALCSESVHNIEQIPVNLDFIFQQKKITVGELEAIYQGTLLTCDPDAEKNIIIRANGLAIATGQLVWFEERPAVEIIHISPEVSGGKR